MSIENVEKAVKTKRDLSSIDTESIQSDFTGSKVEKYLKAATGNAAKEQKIQEIKAMKERTERERLEHFEQQQQKTTRKLEEFKTAR